ncbi:MAG: hypothetical protein ACQEXJ_04785 [Myxococcota bacterium]
MSETRRWIPALGLLLLMLAGCAEAPEERLEGAWKAAEAEDVEAFALYFTPPSAEVIRGMVNVTERTRGKMEYLDDPFAVLPRGEIMGVEERGDLAVVTVKPKGDPYEVRMTTHRGQWRIDGFALPEMWAPLEERDDLW